MWKKLELVLLYVNSLVMAILSTQDLLQISKSRMVLSFLRGMDIIEFRILFYVVHNSSFKDIIRGIGTCLNGSSPLKCLKKKTHENKYIIQSINVIIDFVNVYNRRIFI